MPKYENLIGQKFARLLVLEKVDGEKRTTFKCLCDCGKEKNIRAENLKDGSTKSCGCLNDEKRSERASLFGINNREFHPRITTARKVFQRRYSDGNLKFEDFLILTQKSCHYCNSEPNNLANAAKDDLKASVYAKENGDFIYNGLDRVDSNLPHDLENLVPCCKLCNFAKRDLPLKEFEQWVKNIYNNMFNK